MLGRRRLFRQALGGGQPAGAAENTRSAAFDELGQYALQRGMLRPAVTLTLQAGRAYAQTRRGDDALTRARRALDLRLNAGQPARAEHMMPRAVAFLRVNGFAAQAATLEKEAAQRLAPLGLSLQVLPNAGMRALPPTCPQCARPLRSDEADWIDAVGAECPWRGSAVKVV